MYHEGNREGVKVSGEGVAMGPPGAMVPYLTRISWMSGTKVHPRRAFFLSTGLKGSRSGVEAPEPSSVCLQHTHMCAHTHTHTHPHTHTL